MRNAKNKTELFYFIADKIADIDTVDPAIVRKDHEINLYDISPCSHEEADMRLFIHAMHAEQEGYKIPMIKAKDTEIYWNKIRNSNSRCPEFPYLHCQ